MSKKVKFIEATEIVKPGKSGWRYVGIELERTKETISLLCVSTRNWEDLEVEELEIKAFKIKTVDKERVHHLFSVAAKSVAMEVTKAEIDLLKAVRNKQFCDNRVKQYFGKPIDIPLNEKQGES